MVNYFRCQKCDKSFDLWVRLRVHNMNNHRNEQRLTAAPPKVTNLPNEVLCLVFSNITSVRDKFRVAGVNRKFRQCMFKEMKRPHPLEMDFHHDQRDYKLCGHVLHKCWWLRVLRLLIEKQARFSSIVLEHVDICSWKAFPAEILQLLVTNPQCLSQLTKIWVKPCWFFCQVEVSLTGLDVLITKCEKLSILKLQFTQIPIRKDPEDHKDPMLDLVPSIKDKHITELDLDLSHCTQQDVIDILRAPKPNTLRKFKLCFRNPMDFRTHEPKVPDPDLIELVRELCLVAPESMEEIELYGCVLGKYPHLPPITELIGCIPRLPSLSYLRFVGSGLQDLQLLLPTMKLLLSNHARQTPLVVHYFEYQLDQIPCCKILACIRQINQDLPGLVFGYDQKMKKMKLRLGSVTVALQKFNNACDDPNCGDCHSSYPVVVHALGHEAENGRDCRLENHWLSKCKINSVVEDLGNMRHCCQFPRWEAIDAKENKTKYQGKSKATVSFKERSHGQFTKRRGKEFKVMVDIGRCFDASCMKCTEE